MNALIWWLIPICATAFAAWWISHQAKEQENDNSTQLSPDEISGLREALDKPQPHKESNDSTD